jgi:hypothetical protein
MLVLEEIALLEDGDGVGRQRDGDIGTGEPPEGANSSPFHRSLHHPGFP